MPSLNDARDEMRTATSRVVRAEQRLRDFALERATWGSAETQQYQALRSAAERARQQRDAAMTQLIERLGGDDE